MARKSNKKQNKKRKKYEDDFIDEEISDSWLQEGTVHTISGILGVVIAIFLLFAPTGNAGAVGNFVHSFLTYLFGNGYYFVPVVFLVVAVSFFRSIRPRLAARNITGSLLFLISGLGFVDLVFSEKAGGLVGSLIGVGLDKLFGHTVSIITASALLIISLLILFDIRMTLAKLLEKMKERKLAREEALAEYEDEYEDDEYEDEPEDEYEEEDGGEPEDEYEEEPTPATSGGVLSKVFSFNKKKAGFQSDYTPPPLSLLSKDSGKPSAGDIKANSNIIKRTLANFGIEVEMDEISVGPSITRYALKPAEGVKLSKIVGLQRELALALAAHPLRIEAPIPGKALVGIEIPNTQKTTVHLGSLLASPEFSESDKPLIVSLGKGISGQATFANLAKMPHGLIAGTTGSGKSVTIHSVIMSLLYKNSPENMRFIMIDPKRVELTLYNKIPHLLTPVITNPKKAILALKWAAKEMDRRYDILESESVRDISSYHENVVAPAKSQYKRKVDKGISEEEKEDLEQDLPENMPYIVVVIDELADIMSTYPREMEAAIVRLAQMSRAVGIHLIISTQRPSTEIITGLIKANVPTRIALQVPSQIDSRTIIDMPGAEKLLGSGDMLYLSADSSKPQRIQSAFVSESEVKKVVNYLIEAFADEVPDEISITEETSGDSLFSASLDDDAKDADDELYEDAREMVIQMKKASTSLIQRKLRVGYARAARILDMLEDRGVVSPQEGSKPRQILVDEPSGEVDEYGEDFDERDNDKEE